MKNLDNIQIQDIALKRDKTEDVLMYICAIIRNTELSKMLKNKKFVNEQNELLNSHADIDPMTCDNDVIFQVLTRRAESFIEHRKRIIQLKTICNNLPSLNEISLLNITDKTHLYLIANTIYSSVIFDEYFWRNTDLNVPFSDWYHDFWEKSYSVKNIKKSMQPILHHMMGQEGDMFYGVKIRKSSINDNDLWWFAISLHNEKKFGFKIQIKPYQPYKAFTYLCLIIFYNYSSNHEINFGNTNNMQTIELNSKDFLIKGNTFQCLHQSHKIKNVIGIINIRDNENQIKQIKVPAGYCKECKVYFILNSTYQWIHQMGIILCKVINEKQYMKAYCDAHEYNLNNQSLLMQYGYNVAQINDLSDSRRQDILSFIIDNNIFSKTEVISYLDFFINQKKSMDNMKNAISKWQKDRAFVENYNHKNDAEIEIHSLYKR